MKLLSILAAAGAVAVTTPASAAPHQGCATFANDQAEIMGAHQRGEPIGNTLNYYDWQAYENAGLWPLMRETTAAAYEAAVPSSSHLRQQQVQAWAEAAYAVCVQS